MQAQHDEVKIREQDLAHVLPTMIEHIHFVGRFNLNLRRRPPFKLADARHPNGQ